jgi:hypothetical protein
VIAGCRWLGLALSTAIALTLTTTPAACTGASFPPPSGATNRVTRLQAHTVTIHGVYLTTDRRTADHQPTIGRFRLTTAQLEATDVELIVPLADRHVVLRAERLQCNGNVVITGTTLSGRAFGQVPFGATTDLPLPALPIPYAVLTDVVIEHPTVEATSMIGKRFSERIDG